MAKRVFLVVAGIAMACAAIVAVVAILNARDPYGGPIEPAGEH